MQLSVTSSLNSALRIVLLAVCCTAWRAVLSAGLCASAAVRIARVTAVMLAVDNFWSSPPFKANTNAMSTHAQQAINVKTAAGLPGVPSGHPPPRHHRFVSEPSRRRNSSGPPCRSPFDCPSSCAAAGFFRLFCCRRSCEGLEGSCAFQVSGLSG